MLKPLKCSRHTVLVREGEPATRLTFLQKGEARVTIAVPLSAASRGGTGARESGGRSAGRSRSGSGAAHCSSGIPGGGVAALEALIVASGRGKGGGPEFGSEIDMTAKEARKAKQVC